MLCPRCSQGNIVSAEIKYTGKVIFVCQECEATWFSIEDIGSMQFQDFGAFMEEIGLSPLWNELNVLSSDC